MSLSEAGSIQAEPCPSFESQSALEMARGRPALGAAVEQRGAADGPVLSRSVRGARTRASPRPAADRGRSLTFEQSATYCLSELSVNAHGLGAPL